ncbi:hypothetical protein AB7M63_007265 [Bradyrhizobium japonicum]
MAHAERREQLTAREAQRVGGVAAGGVADQVREHDGVAVVIIPHRARRGRKRHARGIGGHVVLDEFHAIDGFEGGAERSLQRAAERKARGVAQQLVDGDGVAGIVRICPRGDRRGPVELELALPHEHTGQSRDHRLHHGEAEQRRLRPDTIRITLGDDAARLHDDDGAGAAIRRLRGFGEGAIECGR